MMSHAIFFDRDGTLIENRHYLSDPDGVCLLPGVAEAMRRLVDAQCRLFLFTNQSGVGRGWFTRADVEACNRRMLELIGLGPDLFTDICIATESPDEKPHYRKPSPRFIEEMIACHSLAPDHCWMVGDSPSDWQAGRAAGIRIAAVLPAIDAHATMNSTNDPTVISSFTSVAAFSNWLLVTCRGSDGRAE